MNQNLPNNYPSQLSVERDREMTQEAERAEAKDRALRELREKVEAFEVELDADEAAIVRLDLHDVQRGEVALKFLRDARAYAKGGRMDLALRKRAAAHGVITERE